MGYRPRNRGVQWGTIERPCSERGDVAMEDFLKSGILEFSAFGRGADGAVSRTFGSQSYRAAAERLRNYMAENGMKSWVDSVGNVHGLYPPDAAQLPVILVGSHLDTVPEGGMFDGLLGVLAGVECVRRLRQAHRPMRFAVHVLATNGEEGNELGGTFGSRCLVGRFDSAVPGMGEKIGKYGLSAEDIARAKMDFSRVRCYLELHIEQGNTLVRAGEEIGIVTGIVGLQRHAVTVRGVSNHAGTTMMAYRKDALVAAARMITEADRLARQYGRNLVATFSRVAVRPNALAVINNRVDMVLEVRNQDETFMEQYIQQVTAGAARTADAVFSPLVKKAPVQCDADIIGAMENACRGAKVRYRKMPSGATHDGNMLAMAVPIGMLFVPSRGGISHSKDEWTDWDQCEKGAAILYDTVVRLGDEAGEPTVPERVHAPQAGSAEWEKGL